MTLGAVALGVCCLILTGGFVADVYQQLGEALIRSHSGHLQISRDGYFERGARKPDEYVIKDPEGLVRNLSAMPEVEGAMARLSFSGLLNNGRADLPVIGEGVEPGAEARLGTSLRYVAGRAPESTDSFGAAIGRGLASALGLRPGDPVVLIASTGDGAMNTLDLEVVGVFESFSQDYDARAIRIPFDAAQTLLGSAGATTVVAVLRRTVDTAAVRERLRGELPDSLEIRDWQQINDFYAKTVDLYDRQFGVLRLIVFFMVLLSVANSVNMSVFERTAEFGTMRALGRRGSDIVRQVIGENVILGALGGAIGVVAGILLAVLISAIGIPMPPLPDASIGYAAKVSIVLREVLFAFVTGVVATTVACLLPARRAARIPVVEALRAAV